MGTKQENDMKMELMKAEKRIRRVEASRNLMPMTKKK